MDQDYVVFGFTMVDDDRLEEIIKSSFKKATESKFSVNNLYLGEASISYAKYNLAVERLGEAIERYKKSKVKEIVASAVIQRYNVAFSILVSTLRYYILALGFDASIANTSDRILRAAETIGLIEDGMSLQLVRHALELEEYLNDGAMSEHVKEIITAFSSMKEIIISLESKEGLIKY